MSVSGIGRVTPCIDGITLKNPVYDAYGRLYGPMPTPTTVYDQQPITTVAVGEALYMDHIAFGPQMPPGQYIDFCWQIWADNLLAAEGLGSMAVSFPICKYFPPNVQIDYYIRARPTAVTFEVAVSIPWVKFDVGNNDHPWTWINGANVANPPLASGLTWPI